MTRKTKYRLKQLSALALAMLTGLEALPAFAQSDSDSTTGPDDQTAVVSYEQAPVAQTPTLTPRVSLQGLGSKEFHLYVDVNLHAYHFDRQAKKEYDFNENNWGGGLEYTNDVVGVMAGYYRNSLRDPSWYVLGRYTPLQFDLTSKDRLNLGIVAGALSGYKKNTMVPGFTYTPILNGLGATWVKTPTSVPGQKPRGFMPAAGVLLSYEHNHQWGVNVIAVPNVKSAGIYGFLGFQARVAIPSSWF
ncbi:TPA: hypothetical protein QDB43_000350 [Burkholderia vietnamiensis]|uniref:hypothetical protein n=1 Tax=Burkholderia pseudomallei TaxID=28450 RepID=UPI000F055FA8|nr:hypothetical protein [Burkholderia pseudomallei]VBG63239.1 Uncharacterised protein [Burkholderia pseudomallei]HDR9236665.1 hypothetical protein [Burkholderia vietnamiensis]